MNHDATRAQRLDAELADQVQGWKDGERLPPSNKPQSKVFNRTDLGNAERLRERHGSRFRFQSARCGDSDAGTWYAWSGKSWEPDDLLALQRAAKESVRSMYREAAAMEGEDERKKFVDWARSCESRARLANAINLLKSEYGIAIPPDHFDRDVWLLNAQNGTVDLRTGKSHPHRADDWQSKITPVSRLPAKSCPQFEAFLREIIPDDSVRHWLHVWLGFCASGCIDEQVLPIFCGVGANGKSALLEIVMAVLGPYSGIASPDLLMARKHEQHPTEIMDLLGKRLIVASETEESRKLRIQFVKQLTGDAKLKGRRMREDFVEFNRTHKTIVTTNSLPRVVESSHATWRRIRVVPFGVVIPPEQQDKGLPRRIVSAEGAAILGWLVRGCAEYVNSGLPACSAIEGATTAYRGDENPIGEFLAERCVRHPPARVTRADVYAAYTAWCEKNHEKFILQRKEFFGRLRDAGFEDTVFKSGGASQRGFTGIGLCSTA